MKKLLLGDEAIAQGAIDAGLSGVYAYPGTPSTEITEYIQQSETARMRGLHSKWCTNEKTAMEAALGMSFMGKRAMVCMKHVGLNVCADPFVNSAMTGVGGGLVVVVADDPSMHSSQDEQDSRFYGRFAMIPIFEPSSQQEAYDMMAEAFDYSERQQLPVLLRVTTRMAHSRAVVSLKEQARAENPLNYDAEAANWVLLPANARRRNDKVVAQQAELEEDAVKSKYNSLTRFIPSSDHRDARHFERSTFGRPDISKSPSHQGGEASGLKPYALGIIASGIAYNYVQEALAQRSPLFESEEGLKRIAHGPSVPDEGRHNSYADGVKGAGVSVLKISQYPLPRVLVRRLMEESERVLIVEEGQPFIEEQVRGVGDSSNVLGRLTGHLPRTGELTPDVVASLLSPEGDGSSPRRGWEEAPSIVAPRPPQLCQGCGHRDVYTALNEVLREYDNARVFGDIGCYTLGFLPPYRAIHSCVDMGASITMAKGAADAGQWPAVAVIGDSTFTHSGMTGLLDAVNEQADITVIISDNLTTAMTGGQDSAGTNKFEAICRGLGVEEEHLHVVVPLPKNMAEIKQIIRDEINYHGVSVIIPRRECIQTFKRHAKERRQNES